MRSIVRKMLSASHYALRVAEADEGIAALEHRAGGNSISSCSTYNMPGFNGIETLTEMQRVRRNVNVVIMTST